jgi:hypothetical protein
MDLLLILKQLFADFQTSSTDFIESNSHQSLLSVSQTEQTLSRLISLISEQLSFQSSETCYK